jgi:predicted acetyltransferase
MGFGYGTKRSLYRIRPEDFPRGAGQTRLTFLTEKHRKAVEACYARFVWSHHGLMERPGYRWSELFGSPNLKTVGTWREGGLTGYLTFQFEKGRDGHFLSNDLLVRELIYDSPEDLRELMRFLHIQADQIDRIILYTQDEFFHFLVRDPRNDSNNLLPQVYHETNTQGVGIMYRIIDVHRFFTLVEEHDFCGMTCRLKIVLEDSFFPENGGSYFVDFEEGHATKSRERVSDVEIKLDVADFSSLVMGAVKFKALHDFGLVKTSDERFVPKLDQLFAAPKPICFTEF